MFLLATNNKCYSGYTHNSNIHNYRNGSWTVPSCVSTVTVQTWVQVVVEEVVEQPYRMTVPAVAVELLVVLCYR